MPLIADIAGDLLARNLAGGATGWDLQAAFLSPDPDQVVQVKDGVGLMTSPRLTVRRPAFQIVVRGAIKDYLGAWAKAEAIRAAFHGWPGGVIGGAYYSLIELQGEILPLGYDQTLRPMFSLNFQTMRSE